MYGDVDRATDRFVTAWSFIAISGPGSATGVVTSTGSPSRRTTSIVTSVAVSLARVRRGMETVAGVRAWLIQLDLADFEDLSPWDSS